MKNINLRKAATVSGSIQTKINELMASMNVSVDIHFNDAIDKKDEVHKATELFYSTMAAIQKLNRIKLAIRKDVAEKNHTIGVNDILAEMAIIDAEVTHLNGLVKRSNPAYNWEVYEEEFRRKKQESQKETTGYGYSPLVTIPLLTNDMLSSLKALANSKKSEKNELSDRLIALNIGNTIGISDGDWKYLTELGIV